LGTEVGVFVKVATIGLGEHFVGVAVGVWEVYGGKRKVKVAVRVGEAGGITRVVVVVRAGEAGGIEVVFAVAVGCAEGVVPVAEGLQAIAETRISKA
jgi:hypothetical protein